MKDLKKFIDEVNALVASPEFYYQNNPVQLIWFDPKKDANPYFIDADDLFRNPAYLYGFLWNECEALLSEYVFDRGWVGNVVHTSLNKLHNMTDTAASTFIEKLTEALSCAEMLKPNQNAIEAFFKRQNIEGMIFPQVARSTFDGKFHLFDVKIVITKIEPPTQKKLQYFCKIFESGFGITYENATRPEKNKGTICIYTTFCYPTKLERMPFENDTFYYYRIEQLRQTMKHCDTIIIPQDQGGAVPFDLVEAIAFALNNKPTTLGLMILSENGSADPINFLSIEDMQRLYDLIRGNNTILSLGDLKERLQPPKHLNADLREDWGPLKRNIMLRLEKNMRRHRQKLEAHLAATASFAFKLGGVRAKNAFRQFARVDHPERDLGTMIDDFAFKKTLEAEQKNPEQSSVTAVTHKKISGFYDKNTLDRLCTTRAFISSLNHKPNEPREEKSKTPGR